MSVDFAASVMRVAGEAAREVRRLFYSKDYTVSSKGKEGPLSTADLLANEILIRGLSLLDSDAAILSEESADDLGRLKKDALWVIDPIDGTREFVSGVPEFAVSVGRVEKGRVTLGAVALPTAERMIVGGPGLGVRVYDLEGRELGERPGLSKKRPGERLTILVSASEHRRGRFKEFESEFTIQPSGSIARKLALLASGTGDLVVSLYPKNDWDICGGTGLVLGHEAGVVIELKAKARRVFNTEDPLSFGLAAGPRPLVDAFVEAFTSKRTALAESYE
ncbi:MAG: hypothetical protein HY042_00205 [Spirochaetia bacterium]|nr:hypothetical protein [Spirochaetia bacterium]